MRRTQWAVFTSMNPRPSAWRALYEPPAEAAASERPAVGDLSQDVRRDGTMEPVSEPVRFE